MTPGLNGADLRELEAACDGHWQNVQVDHRVLRALVARVRELEEALEETHKRDPAFDKLNEIARGVLGVFESIELAKEKGRAEAAEKRVGGVEAERDHYRARAKSLETDGLRLAELLTSRLKAAEAERDSARRYAYDMEAELAAEARRPLPPDVLADTLQDRIHPASGRLLSASPVFAKPTAGIREALEAAVDFIATGDFTDDARRQAIAQAETALKVPGAILPPVDPADERIVDALVAKRTGPGRPMADAAVREALVNLRKAGDLLWPVIFGETDMSWAEAYASFCEASENADKALAGAEAGERRVFEGEALETDTPCICDDDSVTAADDWLDGLEGKRVRLTVEVLPDP